MAGSHPRLLCRYPLAHDNNGHVAPVALARPHVANHLVEIYPAQAIELAKQGCKGSILLNLSGRGDKDIDFVVANYGKRYGI